MPVVFALFTVGGILAYAGYKGLSIVEVFAGERGRTLDPRGGTTAQYGADVPAGTYGNTAPALRGGTVTIDGKPVANWIAPVVQYAKQHGWTGTVTSGFRNDKQQASACEHVCGNSNGCPGRCAAPGNSNHRYTQYPRGAVDVTEPQEFSQAISTYPGGPPLVNRLPWDRVHFSHNGH